MGSAKYQVDGHPVTSGPGFGVTVHDDVLTEPLRWRSPKKVFVNSMSDVAHARVSSEFVIKMFAVMVAARQHSFQVLTKRPRRLEQLLAASDFQTAVLQQAAQHGADLDAHAWPAPNIWIGTSIESDEYCWRAETLRRTPAAVRFLSLEPLLGPLPSLDLTGIDWVIAGGESGPGARPMHPDWVRSIRDQCVEAGIAFFFKQWGSWQLISEDDPTVSADASVRSHGKPRYRIGTDGSVGDPSTWTAGDVIMVGARPDAAGRELDGHCWDEYPD